MKLSNTEKEGIKAYIFLTFFFTAFVVGLNRQYWENTALICILFSLVGLILFFLNLYFQRLGNGKMIFIFRLLVASFQPLTLGILGMGIAMWAQVIVPHWGWISLLLMSFWGLWIIPVLLPILSQNIWQNIIEPEARWARLFLGAIIGGGASSPMLFSALGRGLSRSGNLGKILVGLFFYVVAFAVQFVFIPQVWNQRNELLGEDHG